MFSALDLLDTMNPHFTDRTDTHEHLDVRWQMSSMAYVMHAKALFGADFGFWAYEALVTASANYVGTILSPISGLDRRATKLDPNELGIRMYELFRDLGAVSEVLWHRIPGGATKGMQEASTSRPENLRFLGDAPDTAFFRTLRGENFEEEKAAFERLLTKQRGS